MKVVTTTKDSDIAVLPARLGGHPLLDELMTAAGFHRDLRGLQGQWLDAAGIPVELLVPAGLEPSGKRGARIPPHDNRAALRVPRLEAAAVDHSPMDVEALDPNDHRSEQVNVAGAAALLVAKAHKLGDRITARQHGSKDRVQAKDAHDVYRLLKATPAGIVPAGLTRLLTDDISRDVTRTALTHLREHASTVDAELCVLAGRGGPRSRSATRRSSVPRRTHSSRRPSPASTDAALFGPVWARNAGPLTYTQVMNTSQSPALCGENPGLERTERDSVTATDRSDGPAARPRNEGASGSNPLVGS